MKNLTKAKKLAMKLKKNFIKANLMSQLHSKSIHPEINQDGSYGATLVLKGPSDFIIHFTLWVRVDGITAGEVHFDSLARCGDKYMDFDKDSNLLNKYSVVELLELFKFISTLKDAFNVSFLFTQGACSKRNRVYTLACKRLGGSVVCEGGYTIFQ